MWGTSLKLKRKRGISNILSSFYPISYSHESTGVKLFSLCSFIIQDHNVISLAFRKQNASSRCSIYDATVTTEMLRQLAQIEVKNTTQKKIGRNDPCPCGSEKNKNVV